MLLLHGIGAVECILGFLEYGSQSQRAAIDPFRVVLIIVELHLHQAAVDVNDAGIEPRTIRFGVHILTTCALHHGSINRIFLHILLYEISWARMHILPHALWCLTNQAYIIMLHILRIAIVIEYEVSKPIRLLQWFGNNARIKGAWNDALLFASR